MKSQISKTIIRHRHKHTEQQMQQAIVAYCRNYLKDKIEAWGSDGTSKSAREGDKKNKLGYEKGNPDLTIFGIEKDKARLPLLIELKRPKSEGVSAGKESKEQKQKREKYIESGYTWIVIDDIGKGIEAIKKYFNLDK